MPTNVGVVGLGTVGGEVAKRLHGRKKKLERRTGTTVRLTSVAEPDVGPALEDLVDSVDYYEDAYDLIEDGSTDVLVELIGGLSPAEEIVTQSLKNGMDVVTANKELLAHRGEQLFDLAAEQGQRIRFEAAVGGCIPAIRTIREAMVDVDFSAIYGIINGTSNYVLTRMREDNLSFDDALEIAQEKGFAEADPTYDVEGTDSVHKLILLSELAFGSAVEFDEVYCDGIRRITPEIIEDAHQFGYRIKLLGIAKKREEGVEVRVHPTLIPEDSSLASVDDQYNAVLTQGDPVGTNMLTGKGAGGAPTATAVISDVVSLSRNRDRTRAPYLYREDPVEVISLGDVQSRFYLRLMVQDKPGVLSRITRILGDCNISIDSVLQIGRSEEELVPVILTTHRASGEEMKTAVERIESLEDVGKEPVYLHIEENLETN